MGQQKPFLELHDLDGLMRGLLIPSFMQRTPGVLVRVPVRPLSSQRNLAQLVRHQVTHQVCTWLGHTLWTCRPGSLN